MEIEVRFSSREKTGGVGPERLKHPKHLVHLVGKQSFSLNPPWRGRRNVATTGFLSTLGIKKKKKMIRKRKNAWGNDSTVKGRANRKRKRPVGHC